MALTLGIRYIMLHTLSPAAEAHHSTSCYILYTASRGENRYNEYHAAYLYSFFFFWLIQQRLYSIWTDKTAGANMVCLSRKTKRQTGEWTHRRVYKQLKYYRGS